MSVVATNSFSTATGNGATRSIPYTFPARNAADVAVYVNGALQTVGITVTPNVGSNGGTVLFTTAPANAAAIIMHLAPSLEQSAQFLNAGAYNPSAVDGANDQAAIRDIYLKGLIDRAALVPLGETMGPLPAAATRMGKFFGFDASGNPIALSGTGNDSALRTDLAATTGPGLVGFNDALAYSAGTVGAQIKSQRVINDLSKFVHGGGITWPFQDLFYDRVEYGQDNAPIAPNAGAANFTTPFYRGMYLGANHIGGGQTGFFLLHVNGAPDPSSTNLNYTPLQTSGCALTNVGGTGLTMTLAKGGFFGGASLGCAYPGATDLLNVTGWEFNAQVLVGASVAYFSLAQGVVPAAHAVSGSVYDIGWSLSAQVGALGLKVGWGISAANGQVPLKTTGALFKVLDAMTFADAFDISLATVTGSAFKSTGFSVDGSGRINATVRGNFANDGAAATGSVPVGEVYRNGSVLQIRVA